MGHLNRQLLWFSVSGMWRPIGITKNYGNLYSLYIGIIVVVYTLNMISQTYYVIKSPDLLTFLTGTSFYLTELSLLAKFVTSHIKRKDILELLQRMSSKHFQAQNATEEDVKRPHDFFST